MEYNRVKNLTGPISQGSCILIVVFHALILKTKSFGISYLSFQVFFYHIFSCQLRYYSFSLIAITPYRIHYVLASLKLSAGNVQTISILYWISFLFNWCYPYWIMYIIILDSRSLLVWLPIEHNIHISITLIHWICHQYVDQYSAPYNLADLILVLPNLFF